MSSPETRHSIPKLAWLSLCVTAGATVLTWMFALVAHLLGKPKPYTWPYYELQIRPGVWNDHHQDLWVYTQGFKHFHTPDFFATRFVAFAYPPATALLYRLFLPALHHPGRVFFLCIALIISTLAIAFFARLSAFNISRWQAASFVMGVVAFSAPLAFEINRLNMEIFVFAIEALAIFCFVTKRYAAFGAATGVVVSLKLYPFMLMALLFGRARSGIAWITASIAVISLTLAGWWAETGSIQQSMHATSVGMAKFSSVFVLSPGLADGWDHSLFGLVKFLRFQCGYGWSVHRWYLVYMATAATLTTALFFLRIRKLPEFNQVCCLLVLTVLIPPTSFEYTLLSLYIPFAMFCVLAVRYAIVGRSVPGGPLYAGCFGALFAVLGFVFCGGFVLWRGGYCGGQFKCLLLCGLLMLALTKPLANDDTVDATAP